MSREQTARPSNISNRIIGKPKTLGSGSEHEKYPNNGQQAEGQERSEARRDADLHPDCLLQQESLLFKISNNFAGILFRSRAISFERNLRINRRLIRIIHASEAH